MTTMFGVEVEMQARQADLRRDLARLRLARLAAELTPDQADRISELRGRGSRGITVGQFWSWLVSTADPRNLALSAVLAVVMGVAAPQSNARAGEDFQPPVAIPSSVVIAPPVVPVPGVSGDSVYIQPVRPGTASTQWTYCTTATGAPVWVGLGEQESGSMQAVVWIRAGVQLPGGLSTTGPVPAGAVQHGVTC